jgi:hypothetical protein
MNMSILNIKHYHLIWMVVALFSSCTEKLSICECMQKGALVDNEVAGCDYLAKLPLKELEDSIKSCIDKMVDETIENFRNNNN